MRTCTQCNKERYNEQMSKSKGRTAGWCLFCVDAQLPVLRPRPVCVKCDGEKIVDQMSRSKGATAGWCLDCVDTHPVERTPPKRNAPTRTPLPPHKLVEFRARYGLTQSGAAQALGCSVPAISSWETGKTSIPRYICLAMSAFVAGLPPYAG